MKQLKTGDRVACYFLGERVCGIVSELLPQPYNIKVKMDFRIDMIFHRKQLRLLTKKPRREFIIHINRLAAIYEACSLEERGHSCFREPGIECVRVIEKRRK